MPVQKRENKTVELWEGKEVEITRPELVNDFDFITDLQKAQKEKDLATLVNMYFALIGGEEVFQETREHIIAKKGIFDINELNVILERISALFPKASSPAQKRW